MIRNLPVVQLEIEFQFKIFDLNLKTQAEERKLVKICLSINKAV